MSIERYGMGSTDHPPPSHGKRGMYGMGSWSESGQDWLSQILGTGLEIVRERNLPRAGSGSGSSAPPVVVMQQPAIPWGPILLIGGGLAAVYLMSKGRR